MVDEVVPSSMSLRVVDAVPGLEAGCRVLVGSSFTGGAGTGGSSAGAALSMPSGPRGPMESSRVSRVVDCARLPYRRGARDFEGAGLAPLLEAGEEGSWVDFEDSCASVIDQSFMPCTSCILSPSQRTSRLRILFLFL